MKLLQHAWHIHACRFVIICMHIYIDAHIQHQIDLQTWIHSAGETFTTDHLSSPSVTDHLLLNYLPWYSAAILSMFCTPTNIHGTTCTDQYSHITASRHAGDLQQQNQKPLTKPANADKPLVHSRSSHVLLTRTRMYTYMAARLSPPSPWRENPPT